jgi:hypothetical protein
MAVKKKFLKRPSALIIAGQAGRRVDHDDRAAAKPARTRSISRARPASRGQVVPVRHRRGHRARRDRVDRVARRDARQAAAPRSRERRAVSSSSRSTRSRAQGRDQGDAREGVARRVLRRSAPRVHKLDGFQTFGVEFTMEGFTIANLCIALGIPFSRIFGAGASISAPMRLATDLNDTDSEQNVCIIATYTLQDGTSPSRSSGAARPTSRPLGAAGVRPVGRDPGQVRLLRRRRAAGRRGAITSRRRSRRTRANKGKVFGKLTGFGLSGGHRRPTTVGTAGAADAHDAHRRRREQHRGRRAGSCSARTTRSRRTGCCRRRRTCSRSRRTLLRAQAIGVVVTPASQTPFASITRTAHVRVGGQSTRSRSARAIWRSARRPETCRGVARARLQELTLAAARVPARDPAERDRQQPAAPHREPEHGDILAAYVAGHAEGRHGQHPQPLGRRAGSRDVGAEMLTGANTSRQFKALPTSRRPARPVRRVSPWPSRSRSPEGCHGHPSPAISPREGWPLRRWRDPPGGRGEPRARPRLAALLRAPDGAPRAGRARHDAEASDAAANRRSRHPRGARRRGEAGPLTRRAPGAASSRCIRRARSRC